MTPELRIAGTIATITLQRPTAANKLAPEDLPVLRAHVAAVNASEQVLVLQLRSTGKHFCAGYDIAEVGGSQAEGTGFGDMVDALEDCRAVTVAVLHGGIYGGATDMALACDFRIGSPAVEMFMPAARLGLHFYASGMQRYVTRLGVDVAKRLFLAGDKLDAGAMQACGFLTHLVSADELEPQTQALCERLGTMAPLALLGMKRHLNQMARGQMDAQSVRAAVLQTLASSDLQEGALAWKEKRAPRFTGR
ncbi:enoyl-CoA hydratase/isomerase family protein [Pseudorhodoferax sp. Leaf267]|uniref:enoyl-CoA hydratase/isomerase family protein n=1 Tax=Pseudorhodoferax sp. Leaf267 TaxID=1736316 RepID=UPI00070203B6|nr:enoyl-CoA hydratase/isomerase family protein [Pseudorhodoferax sp. Leaf267]KQP12703.1 3-hydroxybutyryl-CoA dehydratase [Pseudorhodoferax sp. Leaf267]